MLKCYTGAALRPPQCRRRGYGAPPAVRRSILPALQCSAVSSSAAVTRLGGLVEDGTSYKESFTVRCYEVGSSRTATVQTIANLLQEAGCNHVQSIGFSTDGFATTMTMRKLGLIWVTSRMHIEMYKYPAWGDMIEIETWCQEEGKIGTRRDWILNDMATGSAIGRATSKFVMMNQDSRKLHRVTDEVREECLAFHSGAPRFAFSEYDSSSKKIPKLQFPAQHLILGLEPRRADVDMNQHVNHVTYLGWALESMPQEIINTHELQTITVDYKRECYYNDAVDSLTSIDMGSRKEELLHPNGNNGSSSTMKKRGETRCQFLHLLKLSSTGLEITRGRTEWRKLIQ